MCLSEAAIADREQKLAIASLQYAKEMGAPIEDLRSATEQFNFLVQNDFEKDIVVEVLSSFQFDSD